MAPKTSTLHTILYIIISISGFYIMRISPATFSVAEWFETMATQPEFRFPENNVLLRRTYTGIPFIDGVLVVLVTAFLPGSAGWDRTLWLLHVHFLVSFGAIVGCLNVEAGRRGNAGNWIKYTALWALFYQTIAGAAILPIYFICHARATSRPGYWTQQSQAVVLPLAKTLLPALALGYALPTIFLLVPMQDHDLKQWCIAFWQFCPLLVNLFWWILSSSISGVEQKAKSSTGTASQRPDLPHLRLVYASMIAVCTAVHFFVVYNVFTSPSISFTSVFLPIWRQIWTPYQSLHYIFQVDFWAIFLAAGIWCLVAVGDLSGAGVTQVGKVTAAVGLVVLTVTTGPGAALNAFWWWKEEKFEKLGMEDKKQ